MRQLCTYLLAALSVAMAQVPTIALAPQGAQALRDATGRVIPGFQLIEVTVESSVPIACYGADVWTAATATGLSVRGENVTRLNLSKAASSDWHQRVLVISPIFMGGAATLSAAGVAPHFHSETAAKGFTAATAAIGTIITAALPVLRANAPDPSPLLSAVLSPTAIYHTPFSGLIGAGFPDKVGAVVVPIKCTAGA